jgi:hypothetical protein
MLAGDVVWLLLDEWRDATPEAAVDGQAARATGHKLANCPPALASATAVVAANEKPNPRPDGFRHVDHGARRNSTPHRFAFVLSPATHRR